MMGSFFGVNSISSERRPLAYYSQHRSEWGMRTGIWRCRDGQLREVVVHRHSSDSFAHWSTLEGWPQWSDDGKFLPRDHRMFAERFTTPHDYDLIEFVGLDCGGRGACWHEAKVMPCRCNRCEGVE